MEKGEALYTDTPEAGLQVQRGTEIKILPIKTRLYYNNFFQRGITATWEEISAAGKKMSFDLSEDFEKAGWDEVNKPSEHVTLSGIDSSGMPESISNNGAIVNSFDFSTKKMEVLFIGKKQTYRNCAIMFTTAIFGEKENGDLAKLSGFNPYSFADAVEFNLTL